MVKRYLLLISALLLSFVAPLTITTTVHALSKADLKFYAQNNIMFIDDEDSPLND